MNVLEVLGLDPLQITRFLIFAVSGILGMIFAYSNIWAESTSPKRWHEFMFGDKKACFKALAAFAVICAGAGGLSYLEPLSGFQLFLAGITMGYLVPAKVKEKTDANAKLKANTNSDQRSTIPQANLESTNSKTKV